MAENKPPQSKVKIVLWQSGLYWLPIMFALVLAKWGDLFPVWLILLLAFVVAGLFFLAALLHIREVGGLKYLDRYIHDHLFISISTVVVFCCLFFGTVTYLLIRPYRIDAARPTAPHASQATPTSFPPTPNNHPSTAPPKTHSFRHPTESAPPANAASAGTKTPTPQPAPGSIVCTDLTQSNCGPNGTINVTVDTPPLNPTWSAESKSSDNPSLPYRQDVTVTPNVQWQPVSFIVICSDEIKDVNPLGFFMGKKDWGVTQQSNKIGFVYFDNPPLAARTSMLVVVSSDKPFRVIDVKPAQIAPRRNVMDPQ